MPLQLKLEKKIADGVWSAIGSISINNGERTGTASVLLKEIAKGKMKLILDSGKMVSKIFEKEVIHYSNAPEILVEKIAPGTEISISNFWFKN